MAAATTPSIHEAQQQDHRVELLKAQSISYSQAKRATYWRTATLILFAVITTGVSAGITDAATATAVSVGGLVLSSLVALVTTHRKSERVAVAVAIKEKFDTQVYQLPWNVQAVATPPSPHEVSALAARYRGHQMQEPWYPDTQTLHRPLDVLACQMSNLGWGVGVHRRWAWTLAVSILLIVLAPVLCTVGGLVSGLAFAQLFVLPWLTLVIQGCQEVSAHFQSARDKSTAQDSALTLWREGLAGRLSEADCRQLQDRIVNITLHNAIVPDWFDARLRPNSEAAAQRSTTSLVREAEAAGRA